MDTASISRELEASQPAPEPRVNRRGDDGEWIGDPFSHEEDSRLASHPDVRPQVAKEVTAERMDDVRKGPSARQAEVPLVEGDDTDIGHAAVEVEREGNAGLKGLRNDGKVQKNGRAPVEECHGSPVVLEPLPGEVTLHGPIGEQRSDHGQTDRGHQT